MCSQDGTSMMFPSKKSTVFQLYSFPVFQPFYFSWGGFVGHGFKFAMLSNQRVWVLTIKHMDTIYIYIIVLSLSLYIYIYVCVYNIYIYVCIIYIYNYIYIYIIELVYPLPLDMNCGSMSSQDKSMLELVFAPCSPIAGGGVNWCLGTSPVDLRLKRNHFSWSPCLPASGTEQTKV